MYVHTVSEACRLLPSSSQWNSIELEFHKFHSSTISIHNDNTPSGYSKSYDCNLFISDKSHFKRFIYVCVALVFIILATVLLVHFLPLNHTHQASSSNLTAPLKQALLFFDAQKSGILPRNNYSIDFRGNSGLQDGNFGDPHVDLVGGYYDSGNNMKFTFPTAYTTTLLSWTVIEYHQKYSDIGELEHVKSIIKRGSDYLLKVFVLPNSTSDPTILYSQVGSTSTGKVNDDDCWQRPEDMKYQRPISICKSNSSDLAGEIIAALSATSLVFKGKNRSYSIQLIKAAEKLFELVIRNPNKQGTYTTDDACGKEARQFYNSSGYLDEIVWGGTWLFFATGNVSHLKYATDKVVLAMNAEEVDDGVFYWNNKLPASAVLLTRLKYFRDPGYPYEETLDSATNMTDLLMCSYLSSQRFTFTPGGLILLRPESSSRLQYAATASFLTKLYSDYIKLTQSSGRRCSTNSFSIEKLHKFSISQAST
ncbi:endoglucanase 21-like isoform X2 [Papaver somniferum]|uniref:endoglucanase 21-like isoform X2 n=1 Tax=Papaver somniferum TaxID=3469 RepID=UPI000E700225|nr:endoglucanase 21-like isoform X2 [Papaver somniferum]